MEYNRASDASVFLAGQFSFPAFLPIKAALCTVAGNPSGDALHPTLNEDAVGLLADRDNLVLGVFDGSANSIVCPYLVPYGINGARFVSGVLKENLPVALENSSLKTALLKMNDAVGVSTKELLERHHITNPSRLPMATATIARWERRTETLSFAHVADSILAVLYHDGSTALLTPDQVEPTFGSVR